MSHPIIEASEKSLYLWREAMEAVGEFGKLIAAGQPRKAEAWKTRALALMESSMDALTEAASGSGT